MSININDPASAQLSAYELRQLIRHDKFNENTSGFAQGCVQGNIVILPKDWANDFLQFCQFNPKPCPLIGMSENAGDFLLPELGKDIDIRSDVPGYRLFVDGTFQQEFTDIKELWRDDLVTFVLGCSFSFEDALIADGLEIRNISENKNVPMYRTNIPCKTAGRFSGETVVSMRPMLAKDAIRAIQICSRFPSVHGAPIHFGQPELIGIDDINKPDYGDSVTIKENEVPVFWACGVTPQLVLEQTKPPFCITHSPGKMLVTDIANSTLAVL
ncbi:putative hydro-lyase [Colwellia sp. 1_MG-2023]|uniref:putative hydro-lyase n=1 Tax=unclassified Colwellia TaxID=196834 RepID=UPI001C0A1D5D|nr:MULTISPECIES: putative hydro-lyase [unclassified Colwellia]MBU2924804.1 putative hydro-lyase [Colwellia sp. C2M11]MDO6653877.1 putative hydro-lyase [Colwellia sp. 3_MG-2023]MDO6667106.1 putative hydro-lyase [Colwellia sp. 2_MG-2023]MDO6691477.1 putative hydro-lyase [Colwellia sp. 1_MG-2023]